MRIEIFTRLFAASLVLGIGLTTQAQAAPDETTLISRQGDPGVEAANYHSTDPAVSGDGRYVAFASGASNLSGTNPGFGCTGTFLGNVPQVYVRDTQTGATTLASRATNPTTPPGEPVQVGASGDGCSARPSISANGRWVAFESFAGNLDPDDSGNYDSDIYLRDMENGVTTLVSRVSGVGGERHDGDGSAASVSDDGRYVSFNSSAGNLSDEDLEYEPGQDWYIDTYVRDLETSTTTLASRATGEHGVAQNNRSWDSGISGDGRHVVWRSWADNIDPDIVGCINIFVRHLDTNTTELVNRASGLNGAAADATSSNPAISYNGQYIAFASMGDNLSNEDYDSPVTSNVDHCGPAPTGDYGGDNDIFVRDMLSKQTMLVSRADGLNGEAAAPISTELTYQGYAPSYRPSISANGRFVAFLSASDNLSPDDRDDLGTDDDFESGLDSFVRDTMAGTTQLVSRETGPNGAGGNGSSPARNAPRVSDDGRFVTFATRATNLSGIDSDAYDDVFLREFSEPPIFGDLVSGHSLTIKDNAQNALQRRLIVRSKGQQIAVTEDPSITGATVRVSGTGLAAQTYELPGAGWRKSGGGYRYSDTSLANGPVRSASIRGGQLKIDATGAQLPAMLGSTPAPVGVVYSNSVRTYCMEFGGKITYKPGESLKGSKAPAPAACPS